ncbi:membrane protein [Pseudomonas sp. S37]|nr:membrane protein [Pseudomonas sp. S37]
MPEYVTRGRSPECRDNNYKNVQETDGMTPFDEYHQRQIAEAIARAERRTDAELVTVLARRADDYAYWPLFWAAVLALAVPGLLQWLTGWPGVRGLLVANVLLFVGLCLLLRNPRLAGWLIPRGLRRWRASRLARQQFREQNLQRTAGATGVLIFVSEAERHVEILVDRGIEHCLDAKARAAIGARFAEQVRQGQTLQGFVECIEACSELLSQHVPPTHARNELPNRLVILD